MSMERELKRPFPPHKIQWRKVGRDKSGREKEVCYITARDVMDRLDQVVGPAGWRTDHKEVLGRIVCTIYLRGSDGEWIGKADGADDSTIEAAKGGLSDALKRSAVQWGIARYLYHPSAFDENKQPAIWATPEGYDELMAKRDENNKNAE